MSGNHKAEARIRDAQAQTAANSVLGERRMTRQSVTAVLISLADSGSLDHRDEMRSCSLEVFNDGYYW